MATRALVVTDMLKDFIEEDGALWCGPTANKIILPIIDKIKQYRRDPDGKIYYACDSHAPDDNEFRRFPRHCVEGTEGAEIISELTPEPEDNIIPKTKFSILDNTAAETLFLQDQVEIVELVGVCTSICILHSAIDAQKFGLDVIVDSNCVADFDPAAHEFALNHMKNVMGVLVL